MGDATAVALERALERGFIGGTKFNPAAALRGPGGWHIIARLAKYEDIEALATAIRSAASTTGSRCHGRAHAATAGAAVDGRNGEVWGALSPGGVAIAPNTTPSNGATPNPPVQTRPVQGPNNCSIATPYSRRPDAQLRVSKSKRFRQRREARTSLASRARVRMSLVASSAYLLGDMP